MHKIAQTITNKLDELPLIAKDLNADYFIPSEHGFTQVNVEQFQI